jgi:hypothetical protein
MIGVISCHSIFNEMAFSMTNRFKFELVKDFNPKEGDIYIVLGAHEKAVELYSVQKQMDNKIGYIIYNSEQAGTDFWKNKYYLMLCKENVVFNYSLQLAKDLEKKFKISTHSFFSWDYLTWETIKEEHEKYDIVFVGAKNEEREEIHQKLLKDFPDKKILFSYDNSYLSPEKLTHLLQNTKILLNIPFYKDNILASHRINKGISCGCIVMSPYSNDDDMNEFYKDYIYFGNNIPKLIKRFYDEDLEIKELKKAWVALTLEIGQKFLPHNLQIIKHVEKKLADKLNKEIST